MTDQRRGRIDLLLMYAMLACVLVGAALAVLGRELIGDDLNALTTPGVVLMVIGCGCAVALGVRAVRAFDRSMRRFGSSREDT